MKDRHDVLLLSIVCCFHQIPANKIIDNYLFFEMLNYKSGESLREKRRIQSEQQIKWKSSFFGSKRLYSLAKVIIYFWCWIFHSSKGSHKNYLVLRSFGNWGIDYCIHLVHNWQRIVLWPKSPISWWSNNKEMSRTPESLWLAWRAC